MCILINCKYGKHSNEPYHSSGYHVKCLITLAREQHICDPVRKVIDDKVVWVEQKHSLNYMANHLYVRKLIRHQLIANGKALNVEKVKIVEQNLMVNTEEISEIRGIELIMKL